MLMVVIQVGRMEKKTLILDTKATAYSFQFLCAASSTNAALALVQRQVSSNSDSATPVSRKNGGATYLKL